MEGNKKYVGVQNHIDLKIIIIGDTAQGKTSIVKRYIENKFEFDSIATIVPYFYKKILKINGILFNIILWDIPGQDRNPIIAQSFANDTNGIIYTCEVNNKKSRENLRKWEQSIKNCVNIEKIPRIIVENKCDLLGDESHYNDDINILKDTAKELGCFQFFRTSALNGYNVDNALKSLINEVIKDIKDVGIEYYNQKKLNKLKNTSNKQNSRCC